eukprot:Nk52_evm10s232 gene=Nk52_evmTU10s232
MSSEGVIPSSNSGGGVNSSPKDQDPLKGMKNVVKLYTRYLRRYPVLTKAVTASAISMVGDIIARRLRGKQEALVGRSTAAFGIFGLCITGPVFHEWYGLLQNWVKGSSKYSTLEKLALDRLLFAPIYTVIFFVAITILKGGSIQSVKESLKKSYWKTLKSNWKVWTPVQYINFTFVPPLYRVIFGNCFALVWNTYLALIQ